MKLSRYIEIYTKSKIGRTIKESINFLHENQEEEDFVVNYICSYPSKFDLNQQNTLNFFRKILDESLEPSVDQNNLIESYEGEEN